MNKGNVKSAACSEVLRLMDKDIEYCEALKIALSIYTNTTREELETELNFFI